MNALFAFVIAVCLFAWPASSRGDDALYSYALVVGSNRGGAGQQRLTFAEDDAERFGALLVELGRTPPGQLTLLAAPSAEQLRDALALLRGRLVQHAQRGERTRLVFYYSGHARAHALSLGEEELPLASLRAQLTSLPSTLTVVILDACQSGAFSGVKGAHSASDFSQVSVSSLRSEGLAVLASSSGAELSQESVELGAGYFTHHLMVGMRGAGDADGDGRVSLDEAYRYAYTQTLSATARTRVGLQHATLETALSGRGDVPLTYPAESDAQLILDRSVAGRLLVQRPDHGAVMAELVKASGTQLSLALPSGRYDTLLREDGSARALACSVFLTRHARLPLTSAACQSVLLDEDTLKKEAAARARGPYERWFAELGFSFSQRVGDAYDHTLKNFGFEEDEGATSAGRAIQAFHLSAAAGGALTRSVSLLLRYDGLEHRDYRRTYAEGAFGEPDEFSFSTRAFSLGARYRVHDGRERLVGFAEADLGLGFGRTALRHEGTRWDERSWGPVLRGALGATLGGRRLPGGFVAIGYVYAPVTKNELGQRHQDGGLFLEVGFRMHGLGTGGAR